MEGYKHGIKSRENATSYPVPLSTSNAVQVVYGTAPVNLTDDPKKTVNRPILATNLKTAVKELGYSDDWEKYTLCQSMYANSELFQVSPVIYINVLDPEKHYRQIEGKAVRVENHQAVLDEQGILADQVVITAQPMSSRLGSAKVGEANTASEGSEITRGTDYISEFDDKGRLIITLLSTGNAFDLPELTVSAKAIAPEMVTEEDLIGYYDVESGTETGFETIRQIHPKLGVVPGLLLAPGWSHKPNIGAALQAKCQDVSGAFTCMCLLDLDTEKAKKYTDCLEIKKELGFDDPHGIVLWPMLLKDGRKISYSAVYGAMASHYTAENQDVPYIYPSNKGLNVDGAVTVDGTEVYLDQDQSGAVNGDGVVTVLHDDGEWKAYGNNTAAYPDNTDPKDRWIGCRRMFDFANNRFVLDYRKKLDSNMNRRQVDDIINSFNIWANSIVSAGMCAGFYIEYRSDENSIEKVLEGQICTRTHLALYTPMEYIEDVKEFDVSALENVMAEEG